MKVFLESLGYVLDQQKNVWIRPNYGGINYNDGDETELKIADIIEQASDITGFSIELRQHCTDWPTLYHLSGTRANILRPFAASIAGDILEIGAGCGAITRYLGESGANVLALEGSPRRAAIARSRTRDLENVTVLAEKFDEFQCDRQFEVITLIGVLEYANLYMPGENPSLAMLERVRSLLKPEGKVMIAIENQLGLKYFAGAPEDHVGQAMYGIEGRYKADQPQTFGRIILEGFLQQAGFKSFELFLPFPDYKLPISVLTQEGLNSKDFDASVFAWQSARRDPQLPTYCNFSPELAWSSIFKNNLALDLANSFLIVASPQTQLNQAGVLAYHYSTDRQAAYCKETVFKRTIKNDIEVKYNRLCRTIDNPTEGLKPEIRFVCPNSDQYFLGNLLSLEFVRIVTIDGWAIEQVGNFIRRHIAILEKLVADRGSCCDITSPYSLLPGSFFDAIPSNIIIRENGDGVLIDTEWEQTESIELGHLLFRSMLWMVGLISRFGHISGDLYFTRGEFIKAVLGAANICLTDEDCQHYIEEESLIQSQVTGRSTVDFMNWWAEQPLPMTTLHQAMAERDGQIAKLHQAVAERDGQIAKLHQAVAERDSIVRIFFASTSWRVTRPLRAVKSLFRRSIKVS